MKLLLTVLMIAQVSIAQSFSSGGMGNGGHPYEIQFKQDAKNILESLLVNKDTLPEALSNINLYQFEMNIEMVEIEVKNRKLKDKFGRIKSALNFPGKKLIQINKGDWEKIKDKDHLRLPLVLHEYLGLSGEEVDNYDTSSTYFEFLEAVLSATSVRQNEQIAMRVKLLKLEDLAASDSNMGYYTSRFKNYREFKKVTLEDIEFVYGGFLSNKKLDKQVISVIHDDAAKNICRTLGFDSFAAIIAGRSYKSRAKYTIEKDNFGVGIKLVIETTKRAEQMSDTNYIICVK